MKHVLSMVAFFAVGTAVNAAAPEEALPPWFPGEELQLLQRRAYIMSDDVHNSSTGFSVFSLEHSAGSSSFTIDALPECASHVLADVFLTNSHEDHFNEKLSAAGANAKNWVDKRGNQPSSDFASGVGGENSVELTYFGDNDGFSSNYGIWYSSQIVPVASKTLHHSNLGINSVNHAGWTYVRVRDTQGCDSSPSWTRMAPAITEFSFSGSFSGSTAKAIILQHVPESATHVLADVFVTANWKDHMNVVFGRQPPAGNKNWVSSRGNQPSSQFASGVGVNEEATLTYFGENDGFSSNYGQWYSSQVLPVTQRTTYVGNYGNSGSNGWVYIRVKAFSSPSEAGMRLTSVAPSSVEFSFSGPTTSSQSLPTTVPAKAKYVLADVFVTASWKDHNNIGLGRTERQLSKNWVNERGQQPSAQFDVNDADDEVTLTYFGENDEFSAYYGQWYSSQVVPVDGNVVHFANHGNSGSNGWVYMRVRGYYSAGAEGTSVMPYVEYPFSGHTARKFTVDGVPQCATHMIADVFVTASFSDHINLDLARSQPGAAKNWVDTRGLKPSSQFAASVSSTNAATLTYFGESDGFSSNYGIWYPSQRIPVDGENIYSYTQGNSGSEGYTYVKVRGFLGCESSPTWTRMDTSVTEFHFSGRTTREISLTGVPESATYVLADVFVTATTSDHMNIALARAAPPTDQNWVGQRGQRPSTKFGAGVGVVDQVLLTYFGESDGFSSNYGIWYSSQIVPVDGNTVYFGNYGNSGSAGWVYIRVKAYSAPANVGSKITSVASSSIEFPWSGPTYNAQTLPGSVPSTAQYVLADVFVTASSSDHNNIVLGRSPRSPRKDWVDLRGQQPSAKFDAEDHNDEVTLTYFGENDGFSSNYGIWYSSQVVPVDGNQVYFGNNGNSGSNGWVHMRVRGYYDTTTTTTRTTTTTTTTTTASTTTTICAEPRSLNLQTVLVNNLGGHGPSTGENVIRFGAVTTVGDNTVDLIIGVAGTYERTETGRNGHVSGNHIFKIVQAPSSSTTLEFSLVDSQTNSPVVLDKFAFSFFDIDGNGYRQLKESVTVCGSSDIFLDAATEIQESDGSQEGCKNFDPADFQGFSNPKDPSDLTDEMRQHTVTALFMQTSSFQVTSTFTGNDGKNTRPMLFAGVQAIGQAC
jgi:ssDNA-specific exonuclease RecJ